MNVNLFERYTTDPFTANTSFLILGFGAVIPD